MFFLSLIHSICPQHNAIILFNHLFCQFYCIIQSYGFIHVQRVRGQVCFERASFDCDIHSVVRRRVLKTAETFSNNSEHILIQLLQAW